MVVKRMATEKKEIDKGIYKRSGVFRDFLRICVDKVKYMKYCSHSEGRKLDYDIGLTGV
jgi:hypothetical protein